jgi:transposase-like protein
MTTDKRGLSALLL